MSSTTAGRPMAKTIIVNGRREVEADEISFADVVFLASGERPGSSTKFFTITYRRDTATSRRGTSSTARSPR
jgi:hypothetical protein